MTLRIKTDLKDSEPRTVFGVKSDRPFAKRFANAAWMNRWLDENAATVTVYTIEAMPVGDERA
jgi:hypothetical protein